MWSNPPAPGRRFPRALGSTRLHWSRDLATMRPLIRRASPARAHRDFHEIVGVMTQRRFEPLSVEQTRGGSVIAAPRSNAVAARTLRNTWSRIKLSWSSWLANGPLPDGMPDRHCRRAQHDERRHGNPPLTAAPITSGKTAYSTGCAPRPSNCPNTSCARRTEPATNSAALSAPAATTRAARPPGSRARRSRRQGRRRATNRTRARGIAPTAGLQRRTA